MWGGSVRVLNARARWRLGPDILAHPPDFDRMLAGLRRSDQRRAVGEALLDQRLVAGIGEPLEGQLCRVRCRRGVRWATSPTRSCATCSAKQRG